MILPELLVYRNRLMPESSRTQVVVPRAIDGLIESPYLPEGVNRTL